MKRVFITGLAAFTITACFISACGSGDTAQNQEAKETATEETIETYDPHRGEGKFENVELAGLDPDKAAKGKAVYEMQCQSCHKLTDELLVGPGWKGVSERHTPSWLLNFMTNTDEMIDKDPKLQAQLEICLVRMPNFNTEDSTAFEILEFMRKNDGVK